jgi:hypothetical protein
MDGTTHCVTRLVREDVYLNNHRRTFVLSYQMEEGGNLKDLHKFDTLSGSNNPFAHDTSDIH